MKKKQQPETFENWEYFLLLKMSCWFYTLSISNSANFFLIISTITNTSTPILRNLYLPTGGLHEPHH